MSQRQELRTRRSELNARSKQKGINIDDLRKENRSPGALNAQVHLLTNEPSGRLSRERLREDFPLIGAFDGINMEFTITAPVLASVIGGLGTNIRVYHTVQSTGTTTALTRTSHPAPAAGSFWFDGVQTVRVGEPPGVMDALFAVYVTRA